MPTKKEELCPLLDHTVLVFAQVPEPVEIGLDVPPKFCPSAPPR
jgi:hypothetical protein